MQWINVGVVLVMLGVSGVSAHAKPALELEGCLAVNSYAQSIRVSAIEKLSLVVADRYAFSLFGEHTFRNYALTNALFGGVEYRVLKGRVQLPVGVVGGMSSLHIGQYAFVQPVVGAQCGVLLWLTEAASVRLHYYAKRYAAEQVVFGSDMFLGVNVRIGQLHRQGSPPSR